MACAHNFPCERIDKYNLAEHSASPGHAKAFLKISSFAGV